MISSVLKAIQFLLCDVPAFPYVGVASWFWIISTFNSQTKCFGLATSKKKSEWSYYQDQTLPTSTNNLLPDQGFIFQPNPFSSPLQPIPWQFHNCSVHLFLWSLPDNFPGVTIWWSPCKLVLLHFFCLENGVLKNKQTKSQDIPVKTVTMCTWETHVAFYSTFHASSCL